MKRKRFVKMMMGRGVSRNVAWKVAEAMRELKKRMTRKCIISRLEKRNGLICWLVCVSTKELDCMRGWNGHFGWNGNTEKNRMKEKLHY